MSKQEQTSYYLSRRPQLLERFDDEARRWRSVLSAVYSEGFADVVLAEAREHFEALIPRLPYIGGDENHLTASLIDSARCLALYQVMKARGRTPAETGKALHNAIMSRATEPLPEIPADQRLTRDQLMERRNRRAARSQLREYPDDYVYQFVMGDGVEFDYGYDFSECATQKLYRAHDAEAFLLFYCFLDFPSSRIHGLGLSRTMTLAEGHPICNHRFKAGRKSEQEWPPPFLEPQDESAPA